MSRTDGRVLDPVAPEIDGEGVVPLAALAAATSSRRRSNESFALITGRGHRTSLVCASVDVMAVSEAPLLSSGPGLMCDSWRSDGGMTPDEEDVDGSNGVDAKGCPSGRLVELPDGAGIIQTVAACGAGVEVAVKKDWQVISDGTRRWAPLTVR